MNPTHPLEKLFHPKNVAVIGASHQAGKQGHRWFKSLLESEFQGRVFAVNPRGGELLGEQVYPSLDEIDVPIDLVYCTLSVERTRDAVLGAARQGVPFALIFTAGYAELGDEGAEAQAGLIEEARAYGMRIVGPNSMGVFSFDWGLDLKHDMALPRGQVGIISQSGNVMLSLWHEATTWDLGFSKAVHFGNQADIPAHDYLGYLGQDPTTKVIVLYLEGLRPGTGPEFIRVAAEVARHKPIVAIKGGRTASGSRAAKFHTAAMAGELQLYSAAFREAGIIEVERFDEVLPVAETLLRCPPLRSPRLAVVGSGGGHSVMVVDALEEQGLEVPAFEPETHKAIAARLPHWAPAGNPVDMTGVFLEDLALFADLSDLALADPQDLGGVVSYGLYGLWGGGDHRDQQGRSFESAAPLLGELQSRLGKPVLFYTPYARSGHASFTAMRRAGVPCYDSIHLSARCLAALRQRALFLERDHEVTAEAGGARVEPARPRSREGRGTLAEPEALAFLREHGFPVVPCETVHTAEEAVNVAEQFGFPVVLKLVSAEIVHKSDVAGVALDLRSADEVAAAFAAVVGGRESRAGASVEGGLVAPYRSGGVELIAGAFRDATFGPVLMVGFGGIFAEILADTAFAPLPTTGARLERLLRGLRGFKLLEGARGRPAADLAAVSGLLMRLGRLMTEGPDIAEIDLNPILVFPEGALIVDASLRFTEPMPNSQPGAGA